MKDGSNGTQLWYPAAMRLLISKKEFTKAVGAPTLCKVGAEVWGELTGSKPHSCYALVEAFDIEVVKDESLSPDAIQMVR